MNPDGMAYGSTSYPDPLAALDADFVAERTYNPPNKWSSILYHNGSPRVLCAKIFPGKLPPKTCAIEFIVHSVTVNTDQESRPLMTKEYKQDFPFNIEARPNSACAATGSARITLAGRINVVRSENDKPYTVIESACIFGVGAYAIQAELFSEHHLGGRLVATASLNFTVVHDNARRLRSGNGL